MRRRSILLAREWSYLRRVVSALLALCLIAALSGCEGNKKMINGETFVREAQAAGFTVTDMMTSEQEKDFYDLYTAENDDVYIQFFYAKDNNVANELYLNDLNDVRPTITGDCLEDETTTADFTKLEVTYPDGSYCVVVRSGGTYMYIAATPAGRIPIVKFLEAISY
jgi:arginyl-tRNA synthetase